MRESKHQVAHSPAGHSFGTTGMSLERPQESPGSPNGASAGDGPVEGMEGISCLLHSLKVAPSGASSLACPGHRRARPCRNDGPTTTSSFP